MDEASLRRGAETANARWDNSVAILVGDCLFAQASEIIADLGPDAVRIQARTFARLVKGQIRETIGRRRRQDPLEHYLSVVADKTGSLIATSARFGAMFAGASRRGRSTRSPSSASTSAWPSSSATTSSTSPATPPTPARRPGTDLREGVPTLPVLLALRSTDPADARLRALLAGAARATTPARRGARAAARPSAPWTRPAPTCWAWPRGRCELLDVLADEPGRRPRRLRRPDRHPHRLTSGCSGHGLDGQPEQPTVARARRP